METRLGCWRLEPVPGQRPAVRPPTACRPAGKRAGLTPGCPAIGKRKGKTRDPSTRYRLAKIVASRCRKADLYARVARPREFRPATLDFCSGLITILLVQELNPGLLPIAM